MEVAGILCALVGLLMFFSGLILKLLPLKILSSIKSRALVTSAGGFGLFVLGAIATPEQPSGEHSSTTSPTIVAGPVKPMPARDGREKSSGWWYVIALSAAGFGFLGGRRYERIKLGAISFDAGGKAKNSGVVLRVPAAPGGEIPRNRDYDDDFLDIEFDDRWYAGETGKSATFTYVDADGVITDRRVGNWRSEGIYVRAYCLDRRASRTFRKDRIEDWEGESL